MAKPRKEKKQKTKNNTFGRLCGSPLRCKAGRKGGAPGEWGINKIRTIHTQTLATCKAVFHAVGQ